ncbi:MAG: CZB domain-containing protein [Bacteroidales bacterium]|nr:CZB domain-containing protein [Bacteroidales bacterium]
MANIEELDKAIGAHGLWKSRLKSAIESGKIDVDIATIRIDNQCAFGRWLYGSTLSSVDKSSSHYKTVKELHTEFHIIAARVAEMAISGKKIGAEMMIASGGDYAKISSKLTQAMMDWKSVSK